MPKSKKTLVFCLLFPLIAGGVSGFLTRNGMETFAYLNKPPLSPPGIVFPIVWTVLYLMMGLASWLVLTSGERPEQIRQALFFYVVQLIVNVLWPVFFFSLGWYLFSFFWLLLLFVLILVVIWLFSDLSQTAAWLMVPYLIWTVFAGYLNLGVYLLN